MPEFERYSIEEAHEEATKMQKKVESGEAEDYADAEDLLEKEKHVKKEEVKTEEALKPGEIKIEGHKWSELTNSVKGLIGALAERESQRLSPLIDFNGIGRLAGAVNQLESFIQKENVEAKDFNNALRGIIGGLELIGKAPQSSNRGEDEDNLTRVFFKVKQLRNDIDTVRGKFSGDEEAIAGTSLVIRSLIDATERAGNFIIRKRQAWKDYLSR